MKAKLSSVALPLALASLIFSAFALMRGRPEPGAAGSQAASSASGPTALVVDGDTEKLQRRLDLLEASLGKSATASGAERSLSQRLDGLERSLAKLQSSFDGISLESVSEDRDAQFRAEEGYLKADEYFAAGKFAIAGEGYLAFLEEHPDHPDAYDILKRARNAFRRAGYADKAIWAQEQLIENIGERRDRDLFELAQLEAGDNRLDDAITHVSEAAELATTKQASLWHRLYWAWYVQRRDGLQAGLEAHRQVQQEIEDAGFSDGRLGERVRVRLDEAQAAKSGRGERRLAQAGGRPASEGRDGAELRQR